MEEEFIVLWLGAITASGNIPWGLLLLPRTLFIAEKFWQD